MKRVLFALLLGALCTRSWGQVSFVSVEPECRIYFSFAAVGVTGNFDNRTRGCDFWVVSYSSFTFAGPLSLALQSAPNAAGSVPGGWVNFAGTILAGVNPNVSLVGAETTAGGYYPWIRMNLTATGAGAGLVVGTAYGWRTGPPNSVTILGVPSFNLAQYGGVAVGAGNPVHVQGNVAAAGAAVGNPVQVAGVDAGSLVRRIRTDALGVVSGGLGSGATGGVAASKTVCDSQAAVTLTGAGNTEIIPLTVARTIRVCHFSASWQSAVDVQFTRGTGANCVVGTANVSGVYEDVLALALDFPDGGTLNTAPGEALCVNLGAAVTGGGIVTYAVY